jgi:hypothetical protein
VKILNYKKKIKKKTMNKFINSFKKFNENLSNNEVYTVIKSNFNEKIAKLVDYKIVDLISSNSDIDQWTIELKIDDTKLDGTEEWLEYFDEPFIIIYSKPGVNKNMNDSELLQNVDIFNYTHHDVIYTVQSYSDSNSRQKLKDNFITEIDNIKILDQDDTQYDVDLVFSFKVV